MTNGFGDGPLGVARPRCVHCNTLLAEYLTPPWLIQCRKCRGMNRAGNLPPEVAERKKKPASPPGNTLSSIV